MAFGIGGGEERSYVIEQLHILLGAGMDVSTAIESLALEVRNPHLQETLYEVKRKIDGGIPFWKSFEGTGIIPDQFLAFIRTGEQSGKLDEQLKMVAEQYAREKEFRSKVLSASIYPVFILVIVAVLGGVNALVILPSITETFSKLDFELPLLTRVILSFGVFLKDYGLIVIPALFFLLFIIAYILFINKKTKHWGQEISLRLPGIKNIIREVELSKFGYILGLLVGSGISIVDALSFLVGYSTVKRYQDLYKYMTIGVDNGKSFKELFKGYPSLDFIMPRSVQNLVTSAEKSGSLPQILAKVGNIYQKKVDLSTQTLSVILEPLLIIIVWVFVLIIALAIIFPLYSIIGNISTF